MEPTTEPQPPIQRFTDTTRLFCVTRTSKYLAMALFIILPFLGGYVGYMNAPVEAVEVERVVVKVKDFDLEKVVDFLNQDGFIEIFQSPLVSYYSIDQQVFAAWDSAANYDGIKRLYTLPKNVIFTSLLSNTGVKINEESPVPLLFHYEDVYYRDQLLAGLTASELVLDKEKWYLEDEDGTVYLIDSNCRDLFVRPGTIEEIETYKPAC